MKKVFKYFMLAAAGIASLASCNKVQEIAVPEDVVLTFTSEKPALMEAGTRTVYNPESGSIDWSAGDQIKVAVTVNGTWMAAEGAPEEGKSAKFYLSNGLAEGGQTGVFRVSDSFKLTTAGTYKFYGLYPAGLSSSNDIPSAPSVFIKIPETQTPPVGSFDSSADVLYAVSDDYQGIPQNRNVDLTWTRAVAHGDITLKKLPEFAAGETVQSIQFSIQEGGDLVGSHYIDLTTGAVTLPNNGTAVNTVTVDLKNVSVNTTDNTLEFWISTLPFTATSIKVVLSTNKKVYTKEYTGISKEFKANYRNLLGISMKGAAEKAKTQLIEDGEYVISSDANEKMMAVGDLGDSFRAGVALDTDAPSDDAIWTITYVEASDAYRIYNADAGKYLFGYTGDENYLEMHDASFSSSNYTNLFTIALSASGEGAYVITPMGNTVRKVGYNKNQPRFALYKGGDYQPVDLNLHSVSFDTTPRIEVVEAEITLPKTAITEARVINTIKRKYFDGAITVSSSADWLSVQNLAAGATDIMATVEANPGDARTATVTLSADGITSQTFTVTQAKNAAQATDVIDRPLTGITGTSYSNWSGKTSNSSAVYAGNSAGGNDAIQLNNNSSKPGIVSTTSGGVVKKIVVTWNSNTTGGRTLNVYGKSSAYSSASDLYGNASEYGALIGTIEYGTSTELTVTDDYEYVGLRSNSGAMYIDKIEITWGDATPDAPISWSASEANATITESGVQFTAPTLSNEQNLPVTYETSAPDVAAVSEAGVVTPLAEGTTTISAAFAGSDSYKAKTVTYTLTVTDSRPVVATPTFSPVAGEVAAGTVVTISTTTEGATIYYTVDGTTPTTASTQGTTVTIDAAKTIKAIAVKAGYKDSEVAMAAYTVPGIVDYTLTFSSATNSKGVSSYTDTWSATCNSFTWILENWNNNNNGWNFVKAGRKNNVSTAYITTQSAIPEEIKTVTITIDAMTAEKINSLKLEVSATSDFAGATSYSFNVATGNQSVSITNSAANRFYRIVADCASGSSNGLITVSKVVYSNR